MPDLSDIPCDIGLINKMDFIREVCSIILAIRKESNLRVRVPLSSVTVCYEDQNYIKEFIELIKEETNVKDIISTNNKFSDIATESIVINFKECGKRYGTKIPDILKCQKNGNWKILDKNSLSIADVILNENEFEINYKPKNLDGNVAIKVCKTRNALILLDKQITTELEIEGLARDLVRYIQQTRKTLNLNITTRIFTELYITSDNNEIASIISLLSKNWTEYIKDQTLSSSLVFNISSCSDGDCHLFQVDDIRVAIKILPQ